MDVSEIIRELKTYYKDDVAFRDLARHLKGADVDRWCTLRGCTRFQLFEAIAEHLAFGFNTSELSFEFCDAVVTDLSGVLTSTSGPEPQLFWDVYSAFDEGEYYHGNNREEDPVEVYTRPMIARIVEGIHKSRTA